ncbi:MAG: glutaredoxin domain-containing protein [Candidatus Woesearchaeota archaeon]
MTVKIYSTPTCPWCKKTKEFFKENNVEFEDIDVASNQEAQKEMIDKSGQMGVPVIDVNGTIIVGYDVDKLKKALKLE